MIKCSKHTTILAEIVLDFVARISGLECFCRRARDLVVRDADYEVIAKCRARDLATIGAVAEGLSVWSVSWDCSFFLFSPFFSFPLWTAAYNCLWLTAQLNFDVFAETASGIHDYKAFGRY
jgi:hypothetical protein